MKNYIMFFKKEPQFGQWSKKKTNAVYYYKIAIVIEGMYSFIEWKVGAGLRKKSNWH